MRVPGDQHVYTNILPKRISARRGGFQTLVESSGIRKVERSELIRRLLLYGRNQQSEKWLFFSLSSGRVVVSQMVGLADLDEYGRAGAYFAHSLLLDRDSFDQAGANPFGLFTEFPFFRNPNSAWDAAVNRGRLPALKLEIDEPFALCRNAAGHWETEELLKLTALGLSVQRRAKNNSSVTFTGTSSEIQTAVQAAFLLLPSRVRLACSFDTLHDGCENTGTYFSMVGLRSNRERATHFTVDCAQRHVRSMPAKIKNSSYFRWVDAELADPASKDFRNLCGKRDVAFEFCEFLDGRQYNTKIIRDAKPSFLNAVCRVVGEKKTKECVKTWVTERLPGKVADRLTQYLLQEANEFFDERDYVGCLKPMSERSWDDTMVANKVYEAYLTADYKSARPSNDELRELRQWLVGKHASPLEVLCRLWTKQDAREILASLDTTTYQEIVQHVLWAKLVPPHHLLVPERVSILLRSLGEEVCLADDLVPLVKALKQCGEIQELLDCWDGYKFELFVMDVSPRWLDTLASVTKGSEFKDTVFRKAILNRIRKGRVVKFGVACMMIVTLILILCLLS